MAENPTLTPPEAEDPINDEGLAPPPETEELPTVVVADAAPPPLGRSWPFDFGSEQFVRSRGVPLETRGTATLLGWIDKCLHTARGALPIHPPAYGLVDPDSIFGKPVAELSAQELEERFRDALTFHPRIADVTNMQIRTDPQSGRAWAQYLVVRDPPSEESALLTVKTSLEADV
jgi:hypothetical protein